MRILVALFFFSLATLALSPQGCEAQETSVRQRGNSAASLNFKNDIMATRSDDGPLYVILGSGFLRPVTFGVPKIFIVQWMKSHPNAVFTPISRMISTNTKTHVPMEIIYIWIEDGAQSLNVDLVRNGIFDGGNMFDMVDNQQALDRMLKNDPKLADTRAEIEKERAAAPQDRTDRLVSEGDYRSRIARIADAGKYARAHGLGIWSHAMKEEREAEGVR